MEKVFETALPRKMGLTEIQTFDGRVREALQSGQSEIRIKAGEVEEIGSWLVGVLVGLSRTAKEKGARVLLQNLSPENAEFFREMGLARLFSLPGSESEKEEVEATSGRVQFERAGACGAVKLLGSIDHPSLAKELRAQAEMNLPQLKILLIDFTEATFLDSDAVGQVIHLHQKLSAEGKELCVCGMNGIIEEIFNSLGLTYLIRSFPDAAQAKKTLS